MGRVEPEVVQGARSAGKTGRDGSVQIPLSPAGSGIRYNKGLGPHQREYHSIAGSYFLQLLNPRNQTDADGIRTVIPGLFIKFRQGRVVLDMNTDQGYDAVHRIEGCDGCKVHKNGVRQHPQFGMDKSFWRADEAAEKGRQAAIAAAIATVKASVAQHPEILEQVLGELGTAEFDLPANPSPSAGAPSAPAQP